MELIEIPESEKTKHLDLLLVGTGDVPSILRFYEGCGFERSHVMEDFFVDNYDHPMYEDGHKLVDMVYLRRRL